MPKRSNDFQRLVTFLEKQLAGSAAKVTESAMVAPTTGGDPKEVDILLEIPVGQRTVTVGIECRDYARRQSRPWIEELSGKFSNLPIDKKVAVSSSGFSKAARKEAAERNIELMTLDEALEEDWPEKVRNWKAGFVRWRYSLVGANFEWGGDPPPLSGERLKAAAIVDANGRGNGTLGGDALQLYNAHAEAAVHKWAEANRDEWSKTAPGAEKWVLPVPFTATRKWAIGPDGDRYELKSLELRIQMSLEVVHAPLRYHTYGETRLATGELKDDKSGTRFQVALIFDEEGRPRTMNVRADREGD